MAEWHGFQPPHPLEIDLQAEQMWIIKKKKKSNVNWKLQHESLKKIHIETVFFPP